MRKVKKIRRKLKNFLLKGITSIAALSWLISGCCLDSENWEFFARIIIVSSAWLYLFLYANGYAD